MLFLLKVEQLGLFATPTHVDGYTNTRTGKFIGPQIAIRHKKMEPHHQASLFEHEQAPAPKTKRGAALDKFISKHGGPARLKDTIQALAPEARAKMLDAMATVGGVDAAAVMEKLGMAAPVPTPVPTPVQAPAAVPAPEFDVSGRTNEQIRHLVDHGKSGWKEAAVAEAARRGIKPAAPEPKEGDTKTEGGIEYRLQGGRWHRTTPEDAPAVEQLTIPEEAFAGILTDAGNDADGIPYFVAPAKTVRSEDRAKAEGEISQDDARARLTEWKANAKKQGATGMNAERVVLSLFDASGEWAKPWVDAGYQVHTFDLQTGDNINDFSVEYLVETLGLDNVDVVLAAPPCTDFASSGAHAWKAKDADGRTKSSIELVRQALRTVEYFRPAVWAMENPVGRIQRLADLPKPTMTFQPANFGDPYTKRTLLWGDFQTNLPLANVAATEGSKVRDKISSSNKYARSLTPEGFAYAFFHANNLADMGVAGALAQEFKGIPREELKAATDAGLSEQEIRSAISDQYFDQDLDAARQALRDAMPAELLLDTATAGTIGEKQRWRTSIDHGMKTGTVLGYTTNGKVRFKSDDGEVQDLPPHTLFPAVPKEGGTKVEDGIEYRLEGGRWHRVTPDEGPKESDVHEREKWNLEQIKKISERQGLGLHTDHMRSPELAATGWSAESAITPFGVTAGTGKAERRKLNTAAAALVASKDPADMTPEDLDLLRKYSGNGGCGDSLNEFYTDPGVAGSMWSVAARLGYPGGTALEPSCATGVFLHTAPAGVRVTGVEMDPVSSKIAGVLHGGPHEIVNASLERFATQDMRQFGVVIGNPPYGPRGALLADDKRDIGKAEEYFIDTGLDKTAPGGLCMLVVPAGIMDSKNGRAFRERMLTKGEFLGAQRMPNTAFEASHTDVTADVIYLRKRPDDVAGALGTLTQADLQRLGVWDDEFLAGSYFAGRGRANVFGTPGTAMRSFGEVYTVNGSMHGVAEEIAKFQPDPVTKSPAMDDVLDGLDDKARARAIAAAKVKPYEDGARVGDVRMIDGVAYVLQGNPPRWHRVDEAMRTEAVSQGQALAGEIDKLFTGQAVDRTKLEADVRAWVAEHGIPAKNQDLIIAASTDKTLYRLIGAVGKDGELSDAVTGRLPQKVEGSFDTLATAMALKSESGSFTVDEMVAATGKDREEVLDHLTADANYAWVIDDDWAPMDTYLTGSLWLRLDVANLHLAKTELTPAIRAKLENQVARLEEAIGPRTLDDVEIKVNTAFIPLDILNAWRDSKVADARAQFPTSTWYKELKPSNVTFDKGVYKVAGGFMNGLMEKYLNRAGVRQDDIPQVDAMNEEFKEWLLASEYREQVEDLYNRKFRGFVQRAYSEEPIDVPGLSNADKIKPHIWSGLRQAMATGKGILGDDVGLGKTVQGLLLARMAKVTGHAQKPIIIVPKSVLANWYAEADKWFAGSRVLTIGGEFAIKNGEMTGRDDDANERKRKYHALSQNDYDFVIISEPAFEELDLDPITKDDFASEDFWWQRGDSMDQAGDKRKKQIRERAAQERAKREFENRTDAIYFNEIGIDMIIADEMHHCFPAGTLVDGIRIENLKPGDLIKSFDHSTGQIELRPVRAIAAMRANRLCRVTLSNGQNIVSTDNHRFFTLQRGYLEAGELTDSCDVIINTPKTTKEQHGSVLQGVREYIHPVKEPVAKGQERGAGLLQQDMLSQVAPKADDTQADDSRGLHRLQLGVHSEQCAAMEKGNGEGDRVLLLPQLCGDMARRQGRITGLAAHAGNAEEAQRGAEGVQLASDAAGACQEDGSVAFLAADESGWPTHSRREREASACSAGDAGYGPGVADGAHISNQNAEGERLPVALQDRYSQPGDDDCNRSGWGQSQLHITERAGRPEGEFLVVARVVRVEILEPGSDGEFERLCPDGLVYDIEVAENHNFFAEGILVHNSKNLYAAKARFGDTPKFLGGQGLSNRALDFNLKSRWILRSHGNKGVYGLTATPTKNSPLEIYSMLSHVAPEAFEAIGIRNSEEFLDRFCEFKKDQVLGTDGTIQDAIVTNGFKNMGELREIMRRYINRRTAADVGLVLPARSDHMHFVDMTPAQEKVYAGLRAMLAESGDKDATGDAHIFSIMDKMNKAALDLEILDPAYHAGAKSPKYDKLVKHVMEGVQDGGQVVFSDYIGSHDKIVAALVAAGIPRKQIGVLNAQVAGSSAKRQSIADAFNAGKLKVVIGNTAVMGEGVNLQKATTDIHHLDLPWEPASVQQRNGRGLRQGNTMESIRIHNYMAKGSFDGYRHQAIESKKDWQDLIWSNEDRIENLAREGKFSRDDIMVMMSADPDDARKKLEANKSEAEQRHAVGERVKAASAFVRFQELKRGYAAIKDKGTKSAARLKSQIDAAYTGLKANKHFPARGVLDSDIDALVEPQSGTVYHKDVAFTAYKDDGAVDGKFVVTGVNIKAGTVTVRDWGGGEKTTVSMEKLQHGIKPFKFDPDEEAAEVKSKMDEAAASKVNNIKAYADVMAMPSHVAAANRESLQRQLFSGAKDYSVRFEYGDIPMVHKETGKVQMVPQHSIKEKEATHEFLLPTDEDRARVENAWMDARRGAKYGTTTNSPKRGRSVTRAERQYEGQYGYSTGPKSNPFSRLVSTMAGEKADYNGSSAAVRALKTKFRDIQLERIRRAPDFATAIMEAAPLGAVIGAEKGNSAGVKWDRKSLAVLWAKAQRQGVLGETLSSVEPGEVKSYGKIGIIPDWAYHGVRDSTVQNALFTMAMKSGHRDLAFSMIKAAERHGGLGDPRAALEAVTDPDYAYGAETDEVRAALHLAEKAGVADKTRAEAGLKVGRLKPPVGGYGYGSQWRDTSKDKLTIRQLLEEELGYAETRAKNKEQKA